VFAQVRPRPPESFRTHLTSMVLDEPSNVESWQCSRASPCWRGRLIDGWSYPLSDGLGNSEGLRPSGCPLHSSAGRSGMSWSARSANSERSTSPAIYPTRGKSRGCAPLREFHSIRSPPCVALACKLPATRPLPYAGVRESLPVRNPYRSEHERTHQDGHGWRSEWRSKP
jgi:hypothetical protein